MNMDIIMKKSNKRLIFKNGRYLVEKYAKLAGKYQWLFYCSAGYDQKQATEKFINYF